jgi:HD-GYP domain-containing protein (c-di-GMP phosphodiesterase class II)
MPSPSAPISTEGSPSVVITTVLENLAARFRPGGLSLFMLRPDGALAWHDPESEVLFLRYLVPALQFPDGSRQGAARTTGQPASDGTIETASPAPGVIAASFAYHEKRQFVGTIGLAGKSADFKLSDEVVLLCSQLGIDGIWLSQQADGLPSYQRDSILRQARMLLGMLRDHVRLVGLEREVASLSAQLANTYEELSLIYQLSGGMRVNRGAGDFFKQACVDLMGVMDVRGVGVSLHAENLDTPGPVLYGQLALPPGSVRRLGDELLSLLRRRPTAVLVNDLSADGSLGWLGEHARRLLAVPLQRQEQVLGCLFALDKRSGDFDTVDAKLLNSIANESAIYLENAMLYEDVRGLVMGLLHSLTSAVDAKDPYTCGHSERVALLSRMIATSAGFPSSLVERIYIAGLLHDVGKIGVPEAVLQKTGRLTAEEFELMKKHPEIGARILRDVRQVGDVIPGVLHHHERFDGKGYPNALAGEQIPLMGRIICLADSFDAMTSNRTYRKALPLEVALTEMRRCSGTQFDPQLTDAFLALGMEKLREIIRLGEARRLVPFETPADIRVA